MAFLALMFGLISVTIDRIVAEFPIPSLTILLILMVAVNYDIHVVVLPIMV